MIRFRYAIAIIPLIIVAGCDWGKYTGYNYEGESLIETTLITGNITNESTPAPIPVIRATVKIGDFITYTDTKGDYSLVYPLGTDDDRNRPVPVQITKPNFFPGEAEILIFPDNNIYNFSLIYAAPIIDSSRLEFFPSEIICYATVSDYQGVDDIEKVEGIFTYQSIDEVITFVSVLMEEDLRFSENSAQYKCLVEQDLPQHGFLLSRSHQITAIDKSGFTDTNEFFRPF